MYMVVRRMLETYGAAQVLRMLEAAERQYHKNQAKLRRRKARREAQEFLDRGGRALLKEIEKKGVSD